MSAAYANILAYHERTKHRLHAYARGPETLDWDAQPKAFRHFEGAPTTPLPLSAGRHDLPFGASPPVAAPFDPASIGAFLELSLAISAWKSFGPDRWAVRCNPSSGNLHPTEAYLICRYVDMLADGIHHYRADEHALELRGELPADAGDDTPQLWIGLSSLLWREAWKYGERSFRYCQLDVGHAIAALACAGQLLGWRVHCVDGLAHAQLAALLGTDREEDFANTRHAFTEIEEAELLLSVERTPDDALPTLPPSPTVWHGRASVIDAHPMYQWPVIGQIAALTRATASSTSPALATAPQTPWPPLVRPSVPPSTAALLKGRRSAQRFDAGYELPFAAFCQLLDATLPRAQAPWNALPTDTLGALLLFVHRVAGIAPGLYLFDRGLGLADFPQAALGARLATLPAHLALHPLTMPEDFSLARLARALQCHQDIASTSCFSLGMLSRFAPLLAANPAAYRSLFHAAGALGQALYLEAEALGLRGTGIGCYFDDEVHALLGIDDASVQSLYHFTIGRPIDDPRIESAPAYPGRAATPEST